MSIICIFYDVTALPMLISFAHKDCNPTNHMQSQSEQKLSHKTA